MKFLDSSRLDLPLLKDISYDLNDPIYEEMTFDRKDDNNEDDVTPHANPQWHNRAFSSFLRGDMLSNVK